MTFPVWIMIAFYSSIWSKEKNIWWEKKKRQEIANESFEIYHVLVFPCYFPFTRCGNIYLEGNLKETTKRQCTSTRHGQQWFVNGANVDFFFKLFLYALEFDMDRLFACFYDMRGFPNSN